MSTHTPLATGMSNDQSDRDFCKACRDELAKRKPEPHRPSAMRAAKAQAKP